MSIYNTLYDAHEAQDDEADWRLFVLAAMYGVMIYGVFFLCVR